MIGGTESEFGARVAHPLLSWCAPFASDLPAVVKPLSQFCVQAASVQATPQVVSAVCHVNSRVCWCCAELSSVDMRIVL